MTHNDKFLPAQISDERRSPAIPGTLGLSGRELARAIDQAEAPEQFVRSLPAQSLYLALAYRGVSASGDLIEIASIEQTKLCMDFDVWQRDELSEDRFWQWLALDDDENTLELLQKVLRCMDLKLFAVILARYVDSRVHEEATDTPPGPGYYTPDKGYTWIALQIEDENRHFLLGRFLALIFETNAELFYQLLSVPGVATPSMLEEEAFVERSKRLNAEGIPDVQYAEELQTPLPRGKLREVLLSRDQVGTIEVVQVVDPLVYEASGQIEPLSSFIQTVGHRDAVESEITLLMNSAMVRWWVDFSDSEAVSRLGSVVRGALNIGLQEAMLVLDGADYNRIYETAGLRRLYQTGLWQLFELRKEVLTVQHTSEPGSDAVRDAIVEEVVRTLPMMPAFVRPDGSLHEEGGKLLTGVRAIETVDDVSAVKELLGLGHASGVSA